MSENKEQFTKTDLIKAFEAGRKVDFHTQYEMKNKVTGGYVYKNFEDYYNKRTINVSELYELAAFNKLNISKIREIAKEHNCEIDYLIQLCKDKGLTYFLD